jgi:hypothetical protein
MVGTFSKYRCCNRRSRKCLNWDTPTRLRSLGASRRSHRRSSSPVSFFSCCATASRYCSFDRKRQSRPPPTRPLGTDVKNGPPPKSVCSNRRPGGFMNSSTSLARLNWGLLVSNLVLTTTVRRNSGSASSTTLRVVALFQSLLSSKHKMM